METEGASLLESLIAWSLIVTWIGYGSRMLSQLVEVLQEGCP